MNKFICKCGHWEYKQENDEIVCKKCGKIIDNPGKVGFFNPSDSKFKKFIVKLGTDIGVEAGVAGTSTLIGIIAPWTLPFTVTALGLAINNSGESLFELLSDKFLTNDSYGKKIGDIFADTLNEIIRKGKKAEKKSDNILARYNNFYQYQKFCDLHCLDVISYLDNKNISTNIYSVEAIQAIISDDFGYPGRYDTSVTENVIFVAKELYDSFEENILKDKDIGLRWLIEKRSIEHNEKLSEIMNFLKNKCTEFLIDDSTYEYIKNYNRKLFLEKNSNITLGKMYLDPAVKEYSENVIDIIHDWYKSDKNIMFIYGASGIGKTSLVTKIIADIYGISGDENTLGISKSHIHPVILREHIKRIEKATKDQEYSTLNIITEIIDVNYSQLDGGLIILDGYDELCVLADEFDKNIFIEKLITDLEAYDIKVLITSRPMKDLIKDFKELPHIELEWKESQLKEWCDKFSSLTDSVEKKRWCEEFKNNYNEIFKNNAEDERLEVFCAPLILYLACTSLTIISANDSIGQFYDNVFHTLSEREHSKKQRAGSVYSNAKSEQRLKYINWQFTKELAYQMFLNETLVLKESHNSDVDHIKYAKDRTIEVLKEKGYKIPKKTTIDTAMYLAVFHFAIGKEKGIEFAHRTVCDYFTAVKIYEDYFAKFDKNYYENQDTDTITFELWHNIIEAFRYIQIPYYIFNYINDLVHAKNSKFDIDSFIKYYKMGLEKGILSNIEILKPVIEYKVSPSMLNIQISRVFRNLTWFLTGLGYKNEGLNHIGIIAQRELLSPFVSNINISEWEMKNMFLKNTSFYKARLVKTDFESAFLRNSDFECANLSGAIMNNSVISNANLKEAILIETKLSGADMRGSNLNRAVLVGATMKRAHLSRAELIEANLKDSFLFEADLKNADLSKAVLQNVILISADLSDANLEEADLRNANLKKAILNSAKLKKANFTCADLSGADLRNTNIKNAECFNAEYCLDDNCKTLFPEGFDPSEKNMVEVDINGNKITNSWLQMVNNEKKKLDELVAEKKLKERAVDQFYADLEDAIKNDEQTAQKYGLTGINAVSPEFVSLDYMREWEGRKKIVLSFIVTDSNDKKLCRYYVYYEVDGAYVYSFFN
ncbi:pentapeptide repeat-containing protein [Ruminococcus flavefaciens]|uniref:pentapeptide repeat-containing protein n=1 Tax=Ruminococcus flavefaciens TaxID=1265 RepID=UPI000687B1BC|nr:pentapeptide repeat-containing protein [Ruminococcus flavefaciens]